MGRAPCCDKANVKKGPWSPEEDAKLKTYIEQYGTGDNWIALPQKIGLKRCGKSCRLRWLNYLRPNIKHGGFSEEEDNIICNLYISIGSRWSIIAAQLPGRTDNDIKNYWNTRLKKKLLGRRKQCSNINKLSSSSSSESDQDPRDHNIAQPILSNSALERLQLHMQFQGLQNPFSFYNNPALWPKLRPVEETKMVQSEQPLKEIPINSMIGQPEKACFFELPIGAATPLSEDYAKINNNLKVEACMSPYTGKNPIDSSSSTGFVPKDEDGMASTFQAEINAILNQKAVSFMTQEDEGAQALDCLKEMGESKDSLVWWSNDLDIKSAASNLWDTASALPSEVVFQDYELLGYNL